MDGIQFEALRVRISTCRFRYTTELGVSNFAIPMSTKGDAVMSEAARSFAEQGEEKGRQGGEAGTDHTEANLNAGPKLGKSACVWDELVRKGTDSLRTLRVSRAVLHMRSSGSISRRTIIRTTLAMQVLFAQVSSGF